MPKNYQTERDLITKGYDVKGAVEGLGTGGLPTQAQMQEHGADCAFRAPDGWWFMCAAHPSAPKRPRVRTRRTHPVRKGA